MEKISFQDRLRSRNVALPATIASVALLAAGCSAKSKAAASTPRETATTASKSLAAHQQSINKNRLGYDVSYPQKNNLPKPAAFAIVGLNGINAATFNPYFGKQSTWAYKSSGKSTQPNAAVYVHTANPGPVYQGQKVSNWPKTGNNQFGNCIGNNSLACAYQFGEELAKNDVAYAIKNNDYRVVRFWLDVEGVEDNYSWQKSKRSNATVLEGMTHQLEKQNQLVGIYSGESDWQNTIGSTSKSSDLAGLPDWILGAETIPSAEANCHAAGFTGKIVIAQVAGQTLDRDITCR